MKEIISKSQSDFRITSILHTDKLENFYGTVTAKVIEHTDSIRVIDIIDSKGTTATHAITWFPPKQDYDPLEAVREEIKNGGLAGKTFKKHNFEIIKKQIEEGTLKIPDALKTKFKTILNHSNFKIYEFWAKNAESESLYGIIAEIDSPDFSPVTNLLTANSGQSTYTDKLLSYLKSLT